MLDYLRLLSKNYYLYMGILFFVISTFLFFRFLYVPKIYLSMAFILSAFFFMIAIIQELIFTKKHQIYQYKDLAKLLILTKKIERELENLGGNGKGMYEKALNISELFPDSMLKNIFKIAEVRNSAIHENPKIEKAEDILQNAKTLLKKIKHINSSKNEKMKFEVFLILKFLIISLFLFVVVKNTYLHTGLGATILGLIFVYYISKYIYLYEPKILHGILLLTLFLGLNLIVYFKNGYVSIFMYLYDMKINAVTVLNLVLGYI